jgi:hypothetical protein
MTQVIKAFKNGHYYSVDSAAYGHAPTFNGVAWQNQPLLQLGNQLGYSATITSKDENDFITSLFANAGFNQSWNAWAGGSSWTGSSDDKNNFYWADPNAPEYGVYFRQNGTNIFYTNWYAGGGGSQTRTALNLVWSFNIREVARGMTEIPVLIIIT